MEFRSLILPCPRCCLFMFFFRFFSWLFFLLWIFWFRLEIHLFTFFPALTFFLFTFFSGVDICFRQWKNRKISTFHKLCTIYIHQITWTNQKIKSVFHFSLSLSLVQWICICCSTWKVSDFFIHQLLFVSIVRRSKYRKKWAWVFDIWSKKKKKRWKSSWKYWARFYSIWPKLQINIFYLIND